MFQDLPPPPAVEEPAEAVTEEIILYHPRLPESIIITGAREQQYIEDSSKPISVMGRTEVARLGEERAVGLLRLLPSAALAETGPRGTQAQLRIRGAEANHSLLFIDGIKANDPAAGNEARFELAASGLYDFLEFARGPQSAVWGSEALGGVVALRSLGAGNSARATFSAEYGSFDSLSGNARLRLGDVATGLVVALGGQRSGGIDSFGEDGERDGYYNLNARFSGRAALADHIALTASGFAIDSNSQFDGFDPVTFLRADTGDESDNQLGAARLGLEYWQNDLDIAIGGSILASENINSLDGNETNRTSAERHSLDATASYSFDAMDFDHRLTAAADHEAEDFRASDIAFGGFTDQVQGRNRTGMLIEWIARGNSGLNLQMTLRHDLFSDFADATSFSAGALIPLFDDVALTANYGEGIAQPSFYDLYGFFPGSFVGNADLKPERSQAYDLGVRTRIHGIDVSALWFQQNLKDEIVDIFDFTTFTATTANGAGNSKRSGVEVELDWYVSGALRLKANYSYLDAEGPKVADGTRLRETRRPKHRAGITTTGQSGDFNYGASLAIVGARFDADFDLFPAERVKLHAYALASARIGYELNDKIELSLRGTNLFDADYQDVVGYETQGRAIFLGISLAP